MLRNFNSLFIPTVLSKILGVLKIFTFTYIFGSGIISDVLILITTILFFWTGVIVTTCVGVVFTNNLSDASKTNKTNQCLKDYASLTFIISVFFGAFSLAFPSAVAKLFIGEGNLELSSALADAIIYFVPVLIVSSLTEIFTVYNQFERRYLLSATNLLIVNSLQLLGLMFIFFLNIENQQHIFMLFSGVTFVSYIIAMILQCYPLEFNLKDLYICAFNGKNLLRLRIVFANTKTVMASSTFLFFPYIINYFLAGIGDGYITAYAILSRIPDLLQSIIGGSLATLLFNELANNNKNIRNVFNRFSRFAMIFFAGVPIAAYFSAVLIFPIIALYYPLLNEAADPPLVFAILSANSCLNICILVYQRMNTVLNGDGTQSIIGIIGIALLTLLFNFLSPVGNLRDVALIIFFVAIVSTILTVTNCRKLLIARGV